MSLSLTIDDDADDNTAAEDDIYTADGLDLDDDINVPVNDNLLKPISPTHDKSLPKTKESLDAHIIPRPTA